MLIRRNNRLLRSLGLFLARNTRRKIEIQNISWMGIMFHISRHKAVIAKQASETLRDGVMIPIRLAKLEGVFGAMKGSTHRRI